MKVSKELEEYIKDLIVNGKRSNSGEDSAGYSNSILMATRAYVMFLGVEQQFAMNFTGQKEELKSKIVQRLEEMEGKDGGREPDPKN